MRKIQSLLQVSSCLASVAMAPAVYPQGVPAAPADEEDEDQIVVDSTLIRGTQTIGSQTISVAPEESLTSDRSKNVLVAARHRP